MDILRSVASFPFPFWEIWFIVCWEIMKSEKWRKAFLHIGEENNHLVRAYDGHSNKLNIPGEAHVEGHHAWDNTTHSFWPLLQTYTTMSLLRPHWTRVISKGQRYSCWGIRHDPQLETPRSKLGVAFLSAQSDHAWPASANRETVFRMQQHVTKNVQQTSAVHCRVWRVLLISLTRRSGYVQVHRKYVHSHTLHRDSTVER